MPHYALDLSPVDLIDLYKVVCAMQMSLDGAIEDARRREGEGGDPDMLLGRLGELVDYVGRWRDSIVSEMHNAAVETRADAIQKLRLALLDCGACPETSESLVDEFFVHWPAGEESNDLRSSPRTRGPRTDSDWIPAYAEMSGD